MLLSADGLSTEKYYYALRGLFQQKYANFKAVVIDNTPQLGVQAEVLGLLKELGRGNDVVVLDRVSGNGL